MQNCSRQIQSLHPRCFSHSLQIHGKKKRYQQTGPEVIIEKITKKGALSNKWRGITLMSIPCKILTKISWPTSSKRTGSFQRRRDCTDHRIIIEQCTEWRRQLYISFLDFEKAFDSRHRDSLWRILRSRGIQQDIVLLIKSFYNSFTCKMGNSDHRFHVKTGVRHGGVMWAFIFNIAIDWVMQRTTENQSRPVRWMIWVWSPTHTSTFRRRQTILIHVLSRSEVQSEVMHIESWIVSGGPSSVT